MIAPLGTLAFLGTLWLLVVVGASILEDSGAKIAAALKGKSRNRPIGHLAPVRIRIRLGRQPRSIRAEPRWRAAA